MPCMECSDGTFRWGADGPCEYDTMEECMADNEMNAATEDTADLAGWSGLLAIEGEPTSDGRVFEAATWRELPLPFSWQVENWERHSGSVVVGRIDSIERRGKELWGAGIIDLGQEAGREVVRQRKLQMQRGVSIDAAVGDGEVEMDPETGRTTFSSIEIGGATIVSFPAFAQAEWSLDDEPLATAGAGPYVVLTTSTATSTSIEVVEAAASGATGLPIADRGRAWDGPGAAARVKSWAGAQDGPNAKYAQAFFVVDGDRSQFGSYHLGFADVVGGTLTAIPRGIFAAAGAVQGSRGASNPAFQQAKGKIAGYYARMRTKFGDPNLKPPWQSSAAEVLTASGEAWRPPRWWFDDPQLERRTGLHVEEDGRIWGHLYGWGECHIGSPPGQCIQVPRGGDYSYICGVDGRGVICDNGEHVMTGPLVLSADHADLRGLTWLQAKDHYAHTGLAVGDLVCGEDDYGVWVAGAVRPGTDPDLVHCLRASGPSGDWRLVGGRLNLIAVLAVNVQGFPALAASYTGGEITALVAHSAPVDAGCGCGGHNDTQALLVRLAAVERELFGARRAAEAKTLLRLDPPTELAARLLAGVT